jgi:aspartyl-tRNA(Asn)/glutamyl-tRNA(Gln) amidotransferase subunit C
MRVLLDIKDDKALHLSKRCSFTISQFYKQIPYICTMKITDEIVDHIAHLSRLEFKGSDKEAIKNDMEKIIDFMDKLSELPTENVEPLIFMSEEVNRLRDDVPAETITHEEALRNAPKKDSDYFRIPKVLDK